MALTDDIISLSLQTTRTMSGVEIVYHRGDDALTFDAIRNRHVDQAVDGGTIVAEAERIDWLFELSELSGLSPAEPSQADWIEYGGEVWEVTEQPGIGYWAKIDPQREWCRVRTTQTAPGTVTPPDATGANLYGLIVTRAAGEAHDAYTVVTLGATAEIADPADPDIAEKILAVATAAAAAGQSARYQIYGELVNTAWTWTPGPIYLAADGSLTQTPGDVQVGIAETPTKVFFGVFAAGPAGPQGETGPAGAAGPGVSAGGSTGEILVKSSVDDYDTEWLDGLTVFEAAGAAASAVGSHESSYTHVLHRGDWAAGTRYYPGNAVQWRGGAYLCLAETIGEEPDGGFDASWEMLADGSGKAYDAITSHVGLANPHSQYALRSEMPALIKATETSVPEGNNSIALGTSKAQIEWIRIATTSTNWTLTLYRKSDYATNPMVIVTARSGNYDIPLSLPYQDESAGGNLHYSFASASGSETHDIEVLGVTLQ